jgi:hypothetical protein
MVERKVLFLPRTSLAKDIVSERARGTLESLGCVNWNTVLKHLRKCFQEPTQW